MYKFWGYFSFLLVISFGCKKSIQTPTVETKKNDISVVVKHKKYTKLKSSSQKMIEDWKEYIPVSEFMKNQESTSPEIFFENVAELKEITKALKDSLNIKSLQTPAFKSRLNVFENEVLRLSDMSEILVITPIEANAQIDKLFLVFGSLNDKINTVYSQQKFNDDINLDDFFKLERDSISNLKNQKSKLKTKEQRKKEREKKRKERNAKKRKIKNSKKRNL